MSNEQVQELLEHANSTPAFRLPNYLVRFDFNESEILRAIDYLVSRDLIKPHGNSNHRITSHGSNILNEFGTYKNFVKTQLAKDLKQEKIDELSEENLRWSTKLARWQVKTKLLPYIISFLSLLVSIIAIYISLRRT